MRQGIELAVQQINDAGGIHGWPRVVGKVREGGQEAASPPSRPRARGVLRGNAVYPIHEIQREIAVGTVSPFPFLC